MKSWSDKKYHYKIINEDNVVIAYVHDYLLEVEKFVKKSKMQISEITRIGINAFDIKVVRDSVWSVQ
jgi:hypothetical protein